MPTEPPAGGRESFASLISRAKVFVSPSRDSMFGPTVSEITFRWYGPGNEPEKFQECLPELTAQSAELARLTSKVTELEALYAPFRPMSIEEADAEIAAVEAEMAENPPEPMTDEQVEHAVQYATNPAYRADYIDGLYKRTFRACRGYQAELTRLQGEVAKLRAKRGPGGVNSDDWLRLKEWAEDEDRKVPELAFSSGWLRAAASATYAALSTAQAARDGLAVLLREAVPGIRYTSNNRELWNEWADRVTAALARIPAGQPASEPKPLFISRFFGPINRATPVPLDAGPPASSLPPVTP